MQIFLLCTEFDQANTRSGSVYKTLYVIRIILKMIRLTLSGREGEGSAYMLLKLF